MAAKRVWSIRSEKRLLAACLGVISSVALCAGDFGVAALGADDKPAKPLTTSTCTAVWSGEYRYPDGTAQGAVPFLALIVQRGETLLGEMTESNTFGDKEQPLLHATLIGKIEPKSGKIEFTKTYDGTGGQSHAVVYEARLSADATTMDEGTWNLAGNVEGTFRLKKKGGPEVKPRKGLEGVAGLWKGEYRYSSASQKPVEFVLVLVPDGDHLTGEITEANTFGNPSNAPWLHAKVEAKIEPKTNSLRFTKTYDGTGKVSHEVHYGGTLSADGKVVKEGTWKIGDATSGTFSLEKETD